VAREPVEGRLHHLADVGGDLGDIWDPRDDDRLIERMIAELTATFADVMGNDPSGSGGGAA
jgi:hypothetical protein